MFPILCRIFEQMHPHWSIRSWSRGPRNAEQPMMRRSGKATEQSLHTCVGQVRRLFLYMLGKQAFYGRTHEWTTPNRPFGLVLASEHGEEGSKGRSWEDSLVCQVQTSSTHQMQPKCTLLGHNFHGSEFLSPAGHSVIQLHWFSKCKKTKYYLNSFLIITG
jgi:hypothetical protein